MKKWISLLVSILFLSSTISLQYTFGVEKGKFAGKITSINLVTKSFQLVGGEKTWSVFWNDKTDFIFEGKKSDPELLKNDTQVLVVGILQEDKSLLEAIIVAWGELPGKDPNDPPKDPGKDPDQGKRPPSVFGKLTNLKLTEKTFELQTKDPQGNNIVVKVSYREETKFIRDKQLAKPEEFKEGEEVTVAGKFNPETKILEAMMVVLGKIDPPKDPGKDPDQGKRPPSVFGKLTNLKLTEKTFELQTKDPQGNNIVVKVSYREETKFIRDKQLAKPEEFKEGEEVTVAGKFNPETKILEAMMVVLGKIDPPKDPGEGDQPPTITGSMKRINLEAKNFQLATKDKQGRELLYEVVFTKETKFFIDKKPAEVNEFKNGDTVTVAGRIDSEKKRIQALVVAKGSTEQPSEPIIKWDKEAVVRENYSIFNEEILDIGFKTSITKDVLLNLTTSEPWLELKSDQVKISLQKFTVKILGDKLTAWKTNTAVINITVTDLPNLNKKIFVSVEAVGNIVIVKIGSNKATVNMKEVLLDDSSIPILKNGRTYVSIRFLGEIVFNNKAKITFDSKTQTVYFTFGTKKVELYIGKSYALVDGVKMTLDAPPFIEKGRTFVPLRFISETFDSSVSFDAKTQTITIVYPGKLN